MKGNKGEQKLRQDGPAGGGRERMEEAKGKRIGWDPCRIRPLGSGAGERRRRAKKMSESCRIGSIISTGVGSPT